MTAAIILLAAAAVIVVQVILYRRLMHWIDALAEMVSDNIARKEVKE